MEDIVTQRVNEFRKSLDLSILAFSKEININQTTLNKQLKEGGCGVQVSTLTQILDTYTDLSAEWLLRGDGSMKKGDNWKVTEFIPVQNNELVEALKDNITLLKENNAMLKEKVRVLEAEKKNNASVPYSSVAAEK